MEDLEIQVQETVGVIECDFESMKAYLTDVLEEYRTATFCDESIPTAKKVIADLRKQQKTFTGRIKDVKTAYMKPFEEFKVKADELVKLYDEPIDYINGQISDFESRRVEAKKETINQIYIETFKGLSELVPLEMVYNPRWENKTFLTSEIKSELTTSAAKISAELNIIRQSPSAYAEKAEKEYLEDLNITAALQKIQEYENVRQTELKAAQELEIQRRVQEALESEKQKAEEIEKAKAEATATALDSYIPEETGAPAEAYLYSISLTPEQKECLELYMNSTGIEYTEV